MKICQLCKKEKPLIDAHIVPKSFIFAHGHNKIISNIESHFSEKSPKGIYDTEILCKRCEGLFSRCDDYAYELLKQSFKPNEIVPKFGMVINNYDYNTLKFFFISLLWRASVSNHHYYNAMSLGPHKERLRKLIIDKNPGSEEEYSVCLRRFTGELSGAAALNPIKCKLDEVNYWLIYFGDYCAYIKVDKRRTPRPFNRIILKPDQKLFISTKEFLQSSEFLTIRQMLN